MPTCNRNPRRRKRRMEPNPIIVRDSMDCRGASEAIAEDLYNVPRYVSNTLRCCDSRNGCREIDSNRRCGFWPSFAHPRWLTCRQLNNRKLCDRYSQLI